MTRKHKKSRKKWWLIPVAAVAIAGVGGYVFFDSRFLPTAKAESIDIGMMTVADAKAKLEKLNAPKTVTIEANGQEFQVELPKRFQIEENSLKNQVKKFDVKLENNQEFETQLKSELENLAFPEGEASQNAKLIYKDDKFVIEPEKQGTEIDKAALIDKILQEAASEKEADRYEASDFYKKPEVTKEDEKLVAQADKLNQTMEKNITLTINGNEASLPKDVLKSSLKEDGSIDATPLNDWVDELNAKYSSLNKPIIFTNIHGDTKKYKNNGAYGWGMDTDQTKTALVDAVKGKEMTKTIDAPLVGYTGQNSEVKNNYIEIDLNDQKMYYFKDGKKVVDTDVITGRYNKGTATVPGFHTIMYHDTDTSLEGTMLDGTKYSVPVKYWMPLLSYGGVVTQIGIHDADYKAEAFGDKEAYKTNLGSNGCINTPGDQVKKIFEQAPDGLPVIIYGDIYNDAPGEFDKPVDHGEAV
ncbi:L,D-transpeptidase family protein [Enterococcus canis]|nr:L,D-transpeptidase family protein [Enterococcus canis]